MGGLGKTLLGLFVKQMSLSLWERVVKRDDIVWNDLGEGCKSDTFGGLFFAAEICYTLR